MNQKHLEELKSAFEAVCEKITELEYSLRHFTEYRQFFPKPVSSMSASDKLKLTRDILKLTGTLDGTSDSTSFRPEQVDKDNPSSDYLRS